MAVLAPIYEHNYNVTETREINQIIKIFEQLHEIMFSLNYGDRTANKIEKEFPKASSLIYKENNIDLYVSSLEEVYTKIASIKGDQNLAFEDIDIDRLTDAEWLKTNNNLGNMLILLFNYKNTQSEGKFFTQTLEHVVPQTDNEEKWPILRCLI